MLNKPFLQSYLIWISTQKNACLLSIIWTKTVCFSIGRSKRHLHTCFKFACSFKCIPGENRPLVGEQRLLYQNSINRHTLFHRRIHFLTPQWFISPEHLQNMRSNVGREDEFFDFVCVLVDLSMILREHDENKIKSVHSLLSQGSYKIIENLFFQKSCDFLFITWKYEKGNNV